MSFRSGSNTDFTFNNLKVNGTLTLANNLEIANLDVQGDTSLNTLEVHGDLSVIGNTYLTALQVNELSNLTDLEVVGDTSLNTLEVHGDAQMFEDFKVTGNTYLSTLQVSGESILTDFEVTGDTSLNDVNITGKTTTNELDCFGPVNFNGPSVNTGYLTVFNELSVVGNVLANNEIITPVELGYVNGLTSNIQSQLDSKVETENPVFSGTVSLPTTKTNGYTYIGNDGSALPSYNLSSYFGAIGGNMTSGQGELDFVNTGYQNTNTTLSAFDWYMMTSATAKSLLMRLYHNGGLMVSGLLNAAAGITTTTLTATGQSNLANVQVTGNLTVTGQITSSAPSNMEVVYYKLQGNGNIVTQTITLLNNTTGTANYSVFPSLYYGFTGSGGTYNASDTSGALQNIVITTRTASSFSWTVQKATANNVNVYVVFLVVYNVGSSLYPSSYSS